MDRRNVEETLELIIDQLASVEHERWSHWQKYMHSKCIKQNDGSLLIPADLVNQWEKQIATSYNVLSEKEKESDREQVRKYLPVIVSALGSGTT